MERLYSGSLRGAVALGAAMTAVGVAASNTARGMDELSRATATPKLSNAEVKRRYRASAQKVAERRYHYYGRVKRPPYSSTRQQERGARQNAHERQRKSHPNGMPNHCIPFEASPGQNMPSGFVSRGASVVTRHEANTESW